MAIIGSLSVVRAQTCGWAWFAPAFDYLEEVFRTEGEARRRLQTLEAGKAHRVELPHGLYAMEQAYFTKTRAEGFFESHRRYVDLQVVVEGAELMGLADIGKLTVTQPFEAERDVIIYADFPSASSLRFDAGEAAVYFPEDGHMPGLRLGHEATLVRKTVVKLPLPA